MIRYAVSTLLFPQEISRRRYGRRGTSCRAEPGRCAECPARANRRSLPVVPGDRRERGRLFLFAMTTARRVARAAEELELQSSRAGVEPAEIPSNRSATRSSRASAASLLRRRFPSRRAARPSTESKDCSIASLPLRQLAEIATASGNG